MAEWTKDPKQTGAYWYKMPGADASIVWVHNSLVFGVIDSTNMKTVEDHLGMDAMFYGPIDKPPAMPQLNIALGDYFTHDRTAKKFVCIRRPGGDLMVEIARAGQ